jgi:hypothetical protein
VDRLADHPICTFDGCSRVAKENEASALLLVEPGGAPSVRCTSKDWIIAGHPPLLALTDPPWVDKLT